MRRTYMIIGVVTMAAVTGCSPRPQRITATVSGSPTAAAQVPSTAPEEAAVSGIVIDASGAPVSGATVRVQATAHATYTDSDGRFTLTPAGTGGPVTISAWADGFYCAKAEVVVTPTDGLVLTLHRYQTNDNPDYAWVPPVGEGSCYSCKPGVTQVWLDYDAHARSAANLRFLTMYNGTDVSGNQSPQTRFGYVRDYGGFPLRPDLSQPYYGPGYRLDFPQTAGNCAACHTPGQAIDAPYGVDPNSVSGVDTFGIHCDFCHKVAAVRLDPETGLPYANMPGVLSMDIRRPFPDDPDHYQLFFGTFDDDNVPEEDTYLPLIEQSQFCAPCHFGTFWDTVVYNSFGEWLNSPYSDPAYEGARTCQQCHMPSPTILEGEPITNVAPDAGGVNRDPLTIHAHTFPGAASEDLLQNAVTMQVEAWRAEDTVVAEVSITNDLTGHHVPSDSPLRHLILLVTATDSSGQPLALLEGPVLPEWCGEGNPAQGYYAGLPGKAYAKVLQELWTEITPSGAYWNPTRVVSDTRLAAFVSDRSAYRFRAPEGTAAVEVSVWYRHAFKELMNQKGWTDQDILMERETLIVP